MSPNLAAGGKRRPRAANGREEVCPEPETVTYSAVTSPGPIPGSIFGLQATMSSCLRLVSEQFPHLRDRVACLFERDEVFRELCEDYEACAKAVARHESDEGLRREYTALQLRLETELLAYLNEAEQPQARK
jgi:hypothetical protein